MVKEIKVKKTYAGIEFNEYQQKIQATLLKKLVAVKPPKVANITIEELWGTILYKFVTNSQKEAYKDIDPVLLLPVLINASKNGLLFERDYNIFGFKGKGQLKKSPVFHLTQFGAKRYLSMNFNVIKLTTEIVWKGDDFVFDLGNSKIIKHIRDAKNKVSPIWKNIEYAYCFMEFIKYGVKTKKLVVIDKETLDTYKSLSPMEKFKKAGKLSFYDKFPIAMGQAKVLQAMIKQVDGLVSTDGTTLSPLEMEDKIVDENQEFKFIETVEENIVQDEKVDLLLLAEKAKSRNKNIDDLIVELGLDIKEPIVPKTYKLLMEKLDE